MNEEILSALSESPYPGIARNVKDFKLFHEPI
jgi:hypothetical protein